MSIRVFLAMVLTGFASAAFVQGGDDKNPLLGEWVVVSMSNNGKEMPKDFASGMSLSADEKSLTMIIEFNGKTLKEPIAYRRKGPKEVDLIAVVDIPIFDKKDKDAKAIVVNKTEKKEVVKLGIYEISGDTFKLAWADVGYSLDASKAAVRPTTFDSAPGVKTAVFRRKAK